MNNEQALALITTLSEGVNPLTGEVLETDSLYNSAEVVRALMLAKQSLEASHQTELRRAALPKNAGKGWTPDEDAELKKYFESGMPINALAKQHDR